MAIRDFIIRTLFNDNGAKDELQSTLDLAQQLVENAWEINIDADTGGVDALVASVDQLGETEQETQSITGYLSDMFESLKGTAEGVSESIGNMVDSISATKVAAGAIIALGANHVFENQRIQDAIAESFTTAEQAGIQQWLASRPPQISYDERAQALIQLRFHGVGTEQAMAFQEAAEKFQFSNAARLGEVGAPDITALMAQYSQRLSNMEPSKAASQGGAVLGSMGRAGMVLANLGISAPTEKDQSAAERELKNKGELIGLTDQQIRQAILLQAVQDQLIKKTTDVDYFNLSATQKVQMFEARIEDLTDSIEDGALPYLLALTDAVGGLVDVINAIPGAPQLLGVAAVALVLAGIVGPLIGLVDGLVFPMIAVGGTAYTLATGLFYTGDAALAAEGAFGSMAVAEYAAFLPIIALVAGLVLLGVGLYEVEQKTHAFSNAWTVFSQSSMGKDLINDVQMLVGLLSSGAVDLGGHFLNGAVQGVTVFEEVVGGAFEKADGFYKFLKDHDALDVVLGFAIGGPIGALITGLPLIEAHLDPIDSFTKLIYYLIRELLTVYTDFVTWIKGVWDDIVGAILGIAKPITDELERLGNWSQGKGYQTNADIAKSQSTGSTTPALNLDTTQMPPGYKTAPGEGDQLIIVGPDDKSIGAATYNHLPDNQNPDLMKRAWDDYYKNHPDAKKPDTPTPSTPAPRNVLSDARAGLSQGVNNELQNQEQQFNAWDKNQVGPASASVDQGPVALFKYGYSAAMGLIDNLKGTPTPTPTTDTTPSSPTPSSPTPITQYKSKIDGHIIDKKTYDNYLGPDQQANYVPAQKGGLITSSGGLIGHEGEPIIPAEIASSSRLQEILESLIDSPVAVMPPIDRSGGSSSQSSPIKVDINIGDISISGAATEKLDESTIRRLFEEIVESKLNPFEIARAVEEVVKRGSAHYGGGS